MFDIGFAEILLLSLVALLVLGPERLPKVARTLGGLTRKARTSWLSLKRSIEAEIQAEELKKPLQQFRDQVDSTVDQVRKGVDEFTDFDPMESPSTRENAPSDPSPEASPDPKTNPKAGKGESQ